MPTIFKTLDLSTKHLPEEVCEELNSYEGVTAHEFDYGWLLYVPENVDEQVALYRSDDEDPDDDECEDSIPESVVAIWRFAAEHGCRYVLLDQDGAEYTTLKSYDW